jgi:hypothetical protein
MLELQMLVLENVCDNRTLFEKELRKSFEWLGTEDLYVLYSWAIVKFRKQYNSLIDCVFLGFDFNTLRE